MRMTQLKGTNFRCFEHETVVGLDNITVLVGKNDSGKSSLFDALGVFFNTNVNQTINTDLLRAIWKHATDLKCQLKDIELKSETAVPR